MNYKRGFIETVGIIILGVALLVASGVTYYSTKHQKETPFVAGSYNPTGGGTYRLQSSIGTSNTSITLTSFKEPVSNIPYTMSYLNSSIEYATIDPQTTYKEFISFTGITQNADGTATLTGVSRGLGFSYPYTASSTLAQSHSGQSILILSNPPQLTNQYAAKANDETISGLWTFSQTPIGINPGGQPNATESVLGVSQLATQLQMASSTALGSSGGAVVLQAKYATSSPYTTGLYIPITRNDGKLNPNFIATTSSDTYNFGGQVNLNASTTLTATTTIAGSSSSKLSINTVPYVFPSSQGSASQILQNNGSGILSWATFAPARYTSSFTSGSASGNGATSFASTTMLTIPTSTLSASSTINIIGNISCANNDGSVARTCTMFVRNSAGIELFSIGLTADATLTKSGTFTAQITFGSGLSNPSIITSGFAFQSSANIASVSGNGFQSLGSQFTPSTVNFSNAQTLLFVVQGATNASMTLSGASIIVNP